MLFYFLIVNPSVFLTENYKLNVQYSNLRIQIVLNRLYRLRHILFFFPSVFFKADAAYTPETRDEHAGYKIEIQAFTLLSINYFLLDAVALSSLPALTATCYSV